MRRFRLPGLIAAALLCAAIVLVPTPDGLDRAGQNALAIFGLCFVLWVTNALPLSVTSLLAIVLLPTFRVLPAARSFELFGNPAIFFILGAFMLAAAMLRSGLSARFALAFLRRFERGPRTLLAGVMFGGGFMAFWMPEHAVAALLFPIVIEIVTALGIVPFHSSYGRALFLALAWGPVIGGVATFLGGARNPLALAILRDHYGSSIGFLDWMVAVAPLSLALMVVAYIILIKFLPLEKVDVSRARRALAEKAEGLGPLGRRERGVALIMVLTIISWVIWGRSFGLASISLLAAVSLFVFDLIEWRSVEEYVNWGVILMYGGAIALAAALNETGAARWLAQVLVNWLGPVDGFSLLMVFGLVAIVLTEAISNVAAVALLLPIAFGLADGAGVSPIAVVYAVAVPAGLALCLPMGSPPNAIAYASGYYPLRNSIYLGALVKLAALGLFALALRFYWPILGIEF